ncbi:hypothetical protein JL720_8384 [Aureococcus anophagefferens]|nr:hypothetical protein JL720_8384 [Aureococcus anophagefferens]
MRLPPLLVVALAGAVEKLDSNQVEQRKLRVYDFSCPESEKHVCACQLRCENPKGKQCQKGIAVCAKHAAQGCAYVAAVGAGRAVRAGAGQRPPLPGPRLRAVKPEVLTIGAAFAAALVAASSTHVLFLEKDFGVAPSHNPDSLARELAASVVALRRGAAIVRLRSITDQGCGTFRRCQRDANMPDWKAQTTFGRRRNWWSFYCPEFSKPGSVADCETGGDVTLRCFTSWDSNWSLNAVLVDRESALEKKWKYARKGAAGKFGPGLALAQYAAATWQKQDGFGRSCHARDVKTITAPRYAMKLALLSITGAAALSGVTTTTDWTAARTALRQRDVGAVVVEGAAAPADAWRGAMEGDACAAVDVSCEACDCAVAAVQSAFARSGRAGGAPRTDRRPRAVLRPVPGGQVGRRPRARARDGHARPRDGAVPEAAHRLCRAVASPLEGPGTVVAPEVNLAVSNLMPAWMVARMDRAEGAATVSPARGAFLLVKGESWGFGHAAAAHRSPAATDARRVLLAFDRLCDVE